MNAIPAKVSAAIRENFPAKPFMAMSRLERRGREAARGLAEVAQSAESRTPTAGPLAIRGWVLGPDEARGLRLLRRFLRGRVDHAKHRGLGELHLHPAVVVDAEHDSVTVVAHRDHRAVDPGLGQHPVVLLEG